MIGLIEGEILFSLSLKSILLFLFRWKLRHQLISSENKNIYKLFMGKGGEWGWGGIHVPNF